MRLRRKRSSSQAAGRLPYLESLEERCVPALTSLLSSAGADALLSPTAVVSQPTVQSAPVDVTTQTTTADSHGNQSSTVTQVTQPVAGLPGLIDALVGNTVLGAGPQVPPGLLHSLVSSISNAVTSTGGTLTGLLVTFTENVVRHRVVDTLLVVTPIISPDELIDMTLASTPLSEPGSSLGHPPAAGPALAALGVPTSTLPALLEPAAPGSDSGMQSLEERGAAREAANPNGVAAETPSLRPTKRAGERGETVPVHHHGELAGPWERPNELGRHGPLVVLVGANPVALSGDADADALDLALQNPRRGLVDGSISGGMFDLAAVSSRWLDAADDLGALDRAFQDFLEGLGDLRQTLTGWVARVGPTPWLLMGVALTLTAHEEIARRRRQARESKDAEEKLDGDPFSVVAT